MPTSKRLGKTLKKKRGGSVGGRSGTRSVKRSSATPKVISIPQLRKSLAHITEYSEKLVKSGKSSTEKLADEFSKEWSKVFGKKLNKSVAKKYIEHVSSMKGKTHKLRGGAQDDTLTGAPLAYLTRPGVDLPYGQFLPYVNKGFDVGVPTQAILQDCGKQDGVIPYPNTGSNLIKGGGLLSGMSDLIAAASFRPFVAQNPTSIQQDAMMGFKGITAGPGPEAWQQTWGYRLPPGVTTPPAPPTYVRDLVTDVVNVQ
jgi:hypothetical protein